MHVLHVSEHLCTTNNLHKVLKTNNQLYYCFTKPLSMSPLGSCIHRYIVVNHLVMLWLVNEWPLFISGIQASKNTDFTVDLIW